VSATNMLLNFVHKDAVLTTVIRSGQSRSVTISCPVDGSEPILKQFVVQSWSQMEAKSIKPRAVWEILTRITLQN